MTFHWAHVCVNTSGTPRTILIVMELNLSGTFGQIIWLANQKSFFIVLNNSLGTVSWRFGEICEIRKVLSKL